MMQSAHTEGLFISWLVFAGVVVLSCLGMYRTSYFGKNDGRYVTMSCTFFIALLVPFLATVVAWSVVSDQALLGCFVLFLGLSVVVLVVHLFPAHYGNNLSFGSLKLCPFIVPRAVHPKEARSSYISVP